MFTSWVRLKIICGAAFLEIFIGKGAGACVDQKQVEGAVADACTVKILELHLWI